MQHEMQETDVVNLTDYLRMAKRWWPVLLLVPLIAAGSAYWFGSRKPPSYTATTSLLVAPATNTPNDYNAARFQARTYSELVTSQFVLDRVIEKLQLGQTVPQLESRINASVIQDTAIINISATSNDPQQAANLANTTAAAFTEWIDELQTSDLNQSAETVAASLNNLQNSIEQTTVDLAALRAKQNPTPQEVEQTIRLESRLDQLQNQYLTLERLEQTRTTTPQSQLLVSNPALPPSSAASVLAGVQDAVLAGLLGFALAAVGVVLYERFNRRLYQPDEVAQRFGVPVLGLIPRMRRKTGLDIVESPQSLTSEAIRALRTSVYFATKEHGMRVLLVTSPQESAGRSAVAANLAGAFARSGQRVVLVDGDMRQPHQHQLFGLRNQDGLAKFLSHPAVPVGALLLDTKVSQLRVLPAGVPQDSPLELLASTRLQMLLSELKQHADIVVVDTPPVAMFSDALLFAAETDRTIVVADAGRTRVNDLRTALEQLNQIKVRVLGIVLHGVKGGHPYVAVKRTASGTSDPASAPERGSLSASYQQRADEHGTRPLNN